MSKAKKLLLTKIILGTLTALAFVLIGLTIFLSGKINQLNKQNKALKELNESYEGFLDSSVSTITSILCFNLHRS